MFNLKKLFSAEKEIDPELEESSLADKDNLEEMIDDMEKDMPVVSTTQMPNYPNYPTYPSHNHNSLTNAMMDRIIEESMPDENWKKRGCVKYSEAMDAVLSAINISGIRIHWFQCKCGNKFTYYPRQKYLDKIGQYINPSSMGSYNTYLGAIQPIPEENLVCPDCFFTKMKQGNGEEIEDLRKEINEQIAAMKNSKAKK